MFAGRKDQTAVPLLTRIMSAAGCTKRRLVDTLTFPEHGVLFQQQVCSCTVFRKTSLHCDQRHYSETWGYHAIQGMYHAAMQHQTENRKLLRANLF